MQLSGGLNRMTLSLMASFFEGIGFNPQPGYLFLLPP